MPKRSKENDSRRMLKHLSAILEKAVLSYLNIM